MSKFAGGSAFAFARDIGEGYHLATERSFRGMVRPQLDQLAFELDRRLREIRGSQVALDDLPAIKARNRKIQRLNSALSMLRLYRQKLR